MDFRLIPPKKRSPSKYDKEEVFVVPAKIKEYNFEKATDKIIPIIIERLDFKTGQLVETKAITFVKSYNDFFKGLGKELPFYTDAIVYKDYGLINFKVIGAYNTGLTQQFFGVEAIMNKDEKSIMDVYKSYYEELNSWVGDMNSNYFDLVQMG